MNGTMQPWWQSKTIWAALVTLIAGFGTMGHYSISAQDQAQLTELLLGAATSIGSIAAMYGRYVAANPIGGNGARLSQISDKLDQLLSKPVA